MHTEYLEELNSTGAYPDETDKTPMVSNLGSLIAFNSKVLFKFIAVLGVPSFKDHYLLPSFDSVT